MKPESRPWQSSGRIKQGENPVPPTPEPGLTVAGLAERFWRLHVAVNCKGTNRRHLWQSA